ncbi:DUF1501 domain-containing protein [Roseiconus nitratireducens]|uniref:DUF1501 domain-containing protein n=1 Tax=Roseiconus nitratireducens TaxID=2605748 RepID=A0A5M6D450_9BACT|nr:DUF1501 domain-containing protein [Roseiconus nitratireducens]KAA5542261.1 DUF1501 domain-containing protein [Roseiconus nitratireducens]
MSDLAVMFPNPGRRDFLASGALGLSGIALSSLLGRGTADAARLATDPPADYLRFAPKAKRVIYLFQSGGPPQHDLFDHKPLLEKVHGQEVPESVFQGQRLTGMTAGQSSFPVAKSLFKFSRFGQSGIELNRELLPHLGGVADEIAVIRSMHTEAINHDPAITFFQTGFQLAGRPSVGAWTSYGLGSENENLPAYVAMTSNRGGQALYDRLWGSGFLPSHHQGVRFRSGSDPVLYLGNPAGMSDSLRRQTLDHLGQLNAMRFEQVGDAEIQTRIAQYEMAYRMQTSVPELTDLSTEPEDTFRLYGEDARRPGTFAYNALMARRLSEQGVRFVQLFHRGWDTHNGLPKQLRQRCGETDQASAALLSDLKRRGLLDETLVIWGGEFGRTVYCQGDLSPNAYGRDHHPRCFSIWLAGGGIKGGTVHGKTDEYGYNIVENPVSVHDLHATLLHLMGIDHERLTFKFQGRHYRLTDVHGKVVQPILA